jgi:hypothetical protein
MSSIEFYISAAVFFVLWTGLLIMAFTGRLRRGLRSRIDDLAEELAQMRYSGGLFPTLERACREIEIQQARLDALTDSAIDLRGKMARSSILGSPTRPVGTRALAAD